MCILRVQLNPKRGARYLGGQASIVAESVEAAIKPLNALPGDALWAEYEGVEGRATYVVEHGPQGLHVVPAQCGATSPCAAR